MNFEEWWEANYLAGIYTEEYWLNEKDAAKEAWNQCAEEAAKVADEYAISNTDEVCHAVAIEIRQLKTKE